MHIAIGSGIRNNDQKGIMSRKIKGIEVDVRSKHCLYITIGKWVIYIDNSTGEEIIDTWKEK
jgi:hypothetical protein